MTGLRPQRRIMLLWRGDIGLRAPLCSASAKDMPKLLWNTDPKMATFILIPGGWQGGWAFEKVANLLIAQGHKAQALTLAGLGEIPAPATNLAFHIDEAIHAIRESSGDLVLVGQSYGGMVITGAADVEPTNIRALVYADAYVPQTGESVWSLTSTRFRKAFTAGAMADGLTVPHPPILTPDAALIRSEHFSKQSSYPGVGTRFRERPTSEHMDGKEVRSLTSTDD